MSDLIIIYDDKELAFRHEGDEVWLSQKEISRLFDTSPQNTGQHIKNILSDEELDKSTIKKFFILADDGKRRKVNHYNLDMIIAVGYRVNSKKGTQFRKWSTSVLSQYLKEGVSVNPAAAESDPEQVQTRFYQQLSPSMKKHLNKHGHTAGYQKERKDNIAERKQLAGQLVRTVDGKPNFGVIMGMFHVSLTGKTKKQLIASYEHATKTTTAIDTLGSIVVNQINLLMQSVRLVLEKYDDDAIPDYQQVRQIERLVNKFAGNIRAHLETLSDELDMPIERLGDNSRKKRLL